VTVVVVVSVFTLMNGVGQVTVSSLCFNSDCGLRTVSWLAWSTVSEVFDDVVLACVSCLPASLMTDL